MGVSSPELLEAVLDGTFSDVLRHVARATLMPPLENSLPSLPEAKKRHANATSAAAAKRDRQESTAAEETRAVRVIRRAGEVVEMKIRNPETDKNLQDDAEDSSEKRGGDALGLSLSWSSDTGRCVDASPVLLVQDKSDQTPDEGQTTVFIGSHSHRIQALDLTAGRLLWERVLGDRIEASAAVSRCGSLVVIGQCQPSRYCVKIFDSVLLTFRIYFGIFPGCYDGCVYFLCAASGKTRWTFETGDAVKSCPAVDPLTGLVIVGSHDGHVYALNPKVSTAATISRSKES